jgi:hypothetical protein
MLTSIPHFGLFIYFLYSSYQIFPILPVHIFLLSQIVTCSFHFTYKTLHWTHSLSYSGIISFAANYLSVEIKAMVFIS